MRITDTLDQLLRTLLTSSQVHEAVAKAAAPSDGTPSPTSDGSDSKAVPAPDELEATGANAAATDEAMPHAYDSEAPVEIAAARVQTPGDTDLERLEVTVKVAESLNLGFHLGAAVDRIAVAAMGGSEGGVALHEAAWLINRYVELLERRPIGADIHASSVRLARTEELLSGLREIADQLDRDESQPEPASMQIVSFEPAPETDEPQAEPADGAQPEPADTYIFPFEAMLEAEESPRESEPLETMHVEPAADDAQPEPVADETPPEPAAIQIVPFEPLPEPEEPRPESEPVQIIPFEPAAEEAQPEPAADDEPAAIHIAPFETMPQPEESRLESEPMDTRFGPATDEAQPEPAVIQIVPLEPLPEPEEPRPESEPAQIVPFEDTLEQAETEPAPEVVPTPFDPLLSRYESQPETEPVQIVPFEPVLGRYGPELQPAPVRGINFEPAPEPLPAEPRPQPPAVQTAGFSTAVKRGDGRSVDPAPTPDDLPPLRHEILVTVIRAFVALAVVTFLVLTLTLIAQWH